MVRQCCLSVFAFVYFVFVFHILKYSCKKHEDIEEEGPSGGEAMLFECICICVFFICVSHLEEFV